MTPGPPVSTHTEPLFPYTTLVRSAGDPGGQPAGRVQPQRRDRAGPVPQRAPGRRLPVVDDLAAEVQGPASAHPDQVRGHARPGRDHGAGRSEENTSELQSLMRISYAVFCLQKKQNTKITNTN